jgi:hypothetical protein
LFLLPAYTGINTQYKWAQRKNAALRPKQGCQKHCIKDSKGK